MNSTSPKIPRLNVKSFLINVVFGIGTVTAQAALLLFGQQASACTVNHLFVQLPSLCLEVCLSFFSCLNISQ